jgi:hypothetical protein
VGWMVGLHAFVRTKIESCDQLSHKFRGTWLRIVGEINLINYSNMGSNLFLKNINGLVTFFFGGENLNYGDPNNTKKRKKKKRKKKGSSETHRKEFFLEKMV